MAITFFVEMVLLYYDIAQGICFPSLVFFCLFFKNGFRKKMFHTSNVIELSLAKNAQQELSRVLPPDPIMP